MSRHKHCYRLHLNTLNGGTGGADWPTREWCTSGPGICTWATIWLTIFITETIIPLGYGQRCLFSAPLVLALPPPPFYYCAHVDGCPFPFRPRSVAKLDLRFPIDLWSIYDATDRDNLPGQLFYDNRRRASTTRWIVRTAIRSKLQFLPDLDFLCLRWLSAHWEAGRRLWTKNARSLVYTFTETSLTWISPIRTRVTRFLWRIRVNNR